MLAFCVATDDVVVAIRSLMLANKMCSAIHVLNNYHNNNSNENSSLRMSSRVCARERVWGTRRQKQRRKKSVARGKSFASEHRKNEVNLHELIVCVSLLSLHFRRKMPSILLFFSSFLSLALLFFLFITVLCFSTISIYLDYLTTCVHYNSLHGLISLSLSLFDSASRFLSVSLPHTRSQPPPVCTWTCNDKFYWKVSLTRIFISSSTFTMAAPPFEPIYL